mgnify:CR=1 FL=1
MAKISNTSAYPFISNLNSKDYLILTDADNSLLTKTVLVATLSDFIVGQNVLGGSYFIKHIIYDKDSYKIWIIKGDEVLLWKEFKITLPISLEYNINF